MPIYKIVLIVEFLQEKVTTTQHALWLTRNMSSPILETARLLFAGYFIALAVAAAMGKHRWLLTYPLQIVYSVVRLLVVAFTFGNVRMTPVIAKQANKQTKRVKKAAGIEKRKAKKNAIEADDSVLGPSSWDQGGENDSEEDDEPIALPHLPITPAEPEPQSPAPARVHPPSDDSSENVFGDIPSSDNGSSDAPPPGPPVF